MSLLMDALKKAEQDKKEAAKRQKEADLSPQEGVESAAPDKLGDTLENEVVDGNTTAEIPTVENTARHSITAEMELEPITGSGDDTAEMPNMDVSAVEPEELTLNVTMNELTLAELSRDQIDGHDADTVDQPHSSIEELQSEEAGWLDETFHGVALSDMEDNPELFQETVQGETFLPGDDASRTYGETLPGIPAAQLAKDIGADDQPTPVAAQTVFAATGTTRSPGLGLKWLLSGVAMLTLIAGLAMYFFEVMSIDRKSISPQVAQGIENLGPPLHETLNLNIESIEETLSGEVGSAATEDEVLAEANTEAVMENRDAPEATPTGEQDTPPLADVDDIAGVDETDPAVDAQVAVLEMSSVEDDNPVPEEDAGLPETITPEPSLIKISRSKAPEDKGEKIREAYSAFWNGEYDTAASLYEETLKEFPDNRDALLGMGAIASNAGDYAAAFKWYARQLAVNPRDGFARAALINLQDRSQLLNSESVIKSMLHESPDTHFLYFTLGNIYAAGSRWAEAQQAFFDAYRLNSSKPDYALNLAISLDHIGQYSAALDYYNAALDLSDKTPSRFDSSQVKTRIDSLSEIAELEH